MGLKGYFQTLANDHLEDIARFNIADALSHCLFEVFPREV